MYFKNVLKLRRILRLVSGLFQTGFLLLLLTYYTIFITLIMFFYRFHVYVRI